MRPEQVKSQPLFCKISQAVVLAILVKPLQNRYDALCRKALDLSSMMQKGQIICSHPENFPDAYVTGSSPYVVIAGGAHLAR